MAAENVEDETRAETDAKLRQYARSRSRTNVALVVFAVAAVVVAVLDPSRFPKPEEGETSPVAAAEVMTEIVMWIAVVVAYVFRGRMAEAQGWLAGKLGATPPFDEPGPPA